MIAKISNHRGINFAQIELGSSLTLIAGPNGSGKTSICQAIGGLICGEPNVYGLTKKDSAKTIRHGQKSGTVSVEDGNGGLIVDIPKGQIKSIGEVPPKASQFAVGFKTFTGLSAKDRIELIRELYDADPTKEQLFEVIKTTGASEAKIEKLWKTIQALGWDTALKQAQDKGREFKGQWNYVTKETYGSQKADGWKPVGWEAVLDNADIDTLKKELEEAQEWYESGLRAEALTDKEREDLQAKAGTLDHAKRLFTKATDEFKAKEKVHLDLSVQDKGYVSEPQECPHCGKALVINSGAICKSEITKAKAKREYDKWEELRSQIDQAHAEKEDAYGVMLKVRTEIKDAEKAAATLRELDQRDNKQINLEDARQEVEGARNRIDLFGRQQEADRLHKLIALNAVIQDALSPTGLRAQVLNEAIEILNDALKLVCKTADWKILDIEVDNAMNVRANSIEYRFLSESEQLFTDIAFQLVIAAREGADLIIIDRLSNIADKTGRNGVLRVLKEIDIPAVVVMAMNSVDEMPARADNGKRAYWIEDGAAVDLMEIKSKAG